MNVSGQLSFAASPFSIVVSILVVLAAALLAYNAWRRSGHSHAVGGLELLRLSIVTFVAILLNQPEWLQQYQPDSRPTIAVLVDRSDSMRTRDVVTDDGSGGAPMSRAQVAAPLADPVTWSSLDERLDVVVQSFSQNESGQADTSSTGQAGTDLNRPLTEANAQLSDLLGIVLVSDGDWNQGRPPVEAAIGMRMRNVPIFTISTGSASRLPDLELVDLTVPTFGPAGKTVRVGFTIDSSLPRDVTTTVIMETSEGERLEKQVRIAAMGRTSDAFSWKPPATSDYRLTVSVPAQPGETIPDNNQLSAPIAIREERLRVLVVESYPRWEYRYLRNALSRDPGVDVSCLLFHPNLSKVGGGSTDYIQSFPEALDELSQFDVVFLGDVGLDDGQLTSEQCELIRGLVEVQASGLVLMPGWQGRQFGLLQTELSDLYPVLFDPAQPEGWGSRTPGQFELTASGRKSLLTKLADTPSENVDVWENLPGFQWYAPVIRAKAGTEVLAVHGEMSNRFGRLPLLVTRPFGAGKVLFMGTDGAWRWRKGVEDKYHYRFWGQVVRWMAYQRNMARGESMRLYYTPDQPEMRQTMRLHAHVMQPSGEPLQSGDVVARIEAPSGRLHTVQLTAEGDRWGVFEGGFVPAEPGQHRVTLACRETPQTLEAKFFVQGLAVEQVGKPARPDVMEELSLVSRGMAVTPADVDQVIERLATLPTPPPTIRRLQLWSHPAIGAVLIAMLTAFWIGRKAVGLI